MLYILNFDIKDSTRIEPFIQELGKFGEYISYMPNCYFLKAKDDFTAIQIYNSFRSVLKDEDLFLLSPANLDNMNGWLSSSVVNWLKKP